MRISTIQIFNIANRSMADANQAMIKTQEQLSTGRRVLHPSDDPVASTKIMQLTDELSSITQYQKNIDIAQNNLTIEEFVLDSVNNLVQRMQELSVQAGNTATMGVNEYRALASEVTSRLDELQDLLNTRNANGDYIFGGFQSTREPFSGSVQNGFRYNGDEGQQFIKIANNTTIATSDSGKSAFVEVPSEHNTISTYASPGNTAMPAASISVGEITDQDVYDDFYPEDVVISFNADNAISPPGLNFTATEKSTGRVLLENQAYTPGTDIDVMGVRVVISGQPDSGTPAVAANRSFGADSAASFSFNFATAETFTITAGGRTETFTLDSNITNAADLANNLNDVANGNAAALASLGLVADTNGLRSTNGVNFTIANGSANIDGVMGLNTTGSSTSTDGVRAQAGDRFFVDSSNKQDILSILARFSLSMENYDGTQESREQLETTVAQTLDNLSNAQTRILDVRAKIGARTNTLESTRSLHLDSEIITTEIMKELRDTDYAEATTRLSAESLILQAAQSSFVRVSRLTLFSQL